MNNIFYYKIGYYGDAEIISHKKEFTKEEFDNMAHECETLFDKEIDLCIDDGKFNKYWELDLYGRQEVIIYILCKEYGFSKLKITNGWY